jgi:hypothetical protein
MSWLCKAASWRTKISGWVRWSRRSDDQRKLYDDAGLARLIRDGVKHDGRGVDTMPSKAFHHANDQTIADVIAFVRSVPDSGEAQPKITYGPLARWNFLTRRMEARAG